MRSFILLLQILDILRVIKSLGRRISNNYRYLLEINKSSVLPQCLEGAIFLP